MNNSKGAGPIYNKNKLRKVIYISKRQNPKGAIKEKKEWIGLLYSWGKAGVCVCGGKGDNKTLGLVIFLHKRKKMRNNNATPHVQVHAPMLWKLSFGSYLR
jgi:hypothetical protein